MRPSIYRPVFAIVLLAVPAGALAVAPAGVAQHAGVAAVTLWLAALGWGFHAMLHHRLAAEDRLAQLESAVALERDAHHVTRCTTQQRMLALDAAWRELEASLCAGDGGGVPERMHALQAAIGLLHEAA